MTSEFDRICKEVRQEHRASLSGKRKCGKSKRKPPRLSDITELMFHAKPESTNVKESDT